MKRKIIKVMDVLIYICIGSSIVFWLADFICYGKFNENYILIMLTMGCLTYILKSRLHTDIKVMDALVFICIASPIGFLLADLILYGKINGKYIFLLIMLTIGLLAYILKSILQDTNKNK